jgi:hypothetical protein
VEFGEWLCNENGLENLARHIIHASFSQERMTYIATFTTLSAVAHFLSTISCAPLFIDLQG